MFAFKQTQSYKATQQVTITCSTITAKINRSWAICFLPHTITGSQSVSCIRSHPRGGIGAGILWTSSKGMYTRFFILKYFYSPYIVAMKLHLIIQAPVSGRNSEESLEFEFSFSSSVEKISKLSEKFLFDWDEGSF